MEPSYARSVKCASSFSTQAALDCLAVENSHRAATIATTTPATIPPMAPPESETLGLPGETGIGEIAGIMPPGAAFGAKGLLIRGVLMEVAFSTGSTLGRPARKNSFAWHRRMQGCAERGICMAAERQVHGSEALYSLSW